MAVSYIGNFALDTQVGAGSTFFCSGLILHLGVKNSYPQLAHHNFFFSKNMKRQMNLIFEKHQLPDDPVIYLVNVNKTDPKQAMPDHENLKILPHIPHLQDKPLIRQQVAKKLIERDREMEIVY